MRCIGLVLGLCLCACSAGREPAGIATCGDNTCTSGTENCWNCSADCACACGDGVCTHGEACATCPADCDCTTLAATPPMGWNSWNRFQCGIDEKMTVQMADALVASGMKDAGYRFINLDDCWQASRDANGAIVADPATFNGGIASLAQSIHDLGLEFGLYTCAGPLTCAGRPGSKDHEIKDMQAYADWGVDCVKVDWCGTTGYVAKTQYGLFHDGIAKSGRNIVLSLCNWGEQDPWVWGAGAGQLWRTSGDITDVFFSMVLNLNAAALHAAYAGPGHWNDPDMLEVGNGKMTTEEDRAHMSLWAILSAPLIAGCDLRTMDAATQAILTNPEVIAVNQDPLGLQGVRVVEAGDTTAEVWAKPLAHPGWRAVVVFNPSDVTATMELATVQFGVPPVQVRDLWARADVGRLEALGPLTLPPHASRMFVLKGTDASPPSGETELAKLGRSYAAHSSAAIAIDTASGGTPLRIRGQSFATGVGVFAGSILVIPTLGHCQKFTASIGIDDAAGGKGSSAFEVWGDGKKLYDSGIMTGADAAKRIEVDLNGRMQLKLVTTAGGDSEDADLGDWAEALVTCQ